MTNVISDIERKVNDLTSEDVMGFLSQFDRACGVCGGRHFTVSCDAKRSDDQNPEKPLLLAHQAIDGITETSNLDFGSQPRWAHPLLQLICQKCYSVTCFSAIYIAAALLDKDESKVDDE